MHSLSCKNFLVLSVQSISRHLLIVNKKTSLVQINETLILNTPKESRHYSQILYFPLIASEFML